MLALEDEDVYQALLNAQDSEESEEEALLLDDELGDEESEDEESEEEFLPALLGAAVPAIAGGIGSLFSGGRRRPIRPGPARPYGRWVPGSNRGSVMTPAGPLQVMFDKRYVTAAQLKAALAEVRKDVSKVSASVTQVDRRYGTALANQDRKLTTALRTQTKRIGETLKKSERRHVEARKRLEKKIDDAQMLSLMMSFLQAPPRITELTVTDEDTAPNGDRTLTVSQSKFSQQGSSMLPLVLMLGGGGLGGGSDSNSLLLVLALSGALGGAGK